MTSDFHAVRETAQGYLRGWQDGEALRFLGIPYGSQTRFMASVPASAWAGMRDALQFGPAAAQIALPHADLTHMGATMSEDCLHLNVFAPSAPGGGRPVMVYLHGGGWTNYTSSTDFFDLRRLVATQDVVAVTLNHRLGVLGFLQTGGDANVGLLDICLALEWVRDNIAAFGGDPGRVTIFGQSGGAAKVAALMGFAPAAGLFHRAIIQSSSGSTKTTPPDEAQMLAAALVREVGDPHDAPLPALLAAAGRVPGVFRPVLDAHPFWPAAPRQSAGLPLLVGCTNAETEFHLRQNPANRSLTHADLRRRLDRFLPCDPAQVQAIIRAYSDRMPRAAPRDLLAAITSAHLFLRNTYRIGELQAETGAPVHAYRFSGLTRAAPHCAELPFIFGTTERYVGPHAAPLSARMMKVWADFARGDGPDWPAYSRGQRAVMDMGPRFGMMDDPLAPARHLWDAVSEYEYSQSRGSFIRD